MKKVGIFRPLSSLLKFLVNSNQARKAHFYRAQNIKNLVSRGNKSQKHLTDVQLLSDELQSCFLKSVHGDVSDGGTNSNS